MNQKYESELREEIIRLYLEEGRTLKSLTDECHFGKGTLRYWLKHTCNISIARVAKLSGIPKSGLWRYERGISRIPANVLGKLAGTYGLLLIVYIKGTLNITNKNSKITDSTILCYFSFFDLYTIYMT